MKKPYRQAVEQHRQRVYSFAAYSLRGSVDAEDVTQEVFIRLWQHWNRIDHDKLTAWLMRVAHNAVIDQVRRNQSARHSVDDYSDVSEIEDATDLQEELDRAACQQQLRRAISELDDPFRSILIMRDVQGFSYRDIEASLEMTESQVKVYLHRGRRKLRDDATLRRMLTGSDAAAESTVVTKSKDRQEQE